MTSERQSKLRLQALVGVLGVALALTGARDGRAATYTVDRFDDVSTTDPGSDPPVTDCDDAVPADCTIRGAILAANASAGADVIDVPAGTYAVVGGGEDDVGLIGDLDVLGDLTILGAGADVTVIDGGGTNRIMDICPLSSTWPVPPVVAIAGLTFQNTGSGSSAGGIRNRLGTLTLTDCVFRSCRAIAVDNAQGTLALEGVLIEDASRAGIRNTGTLTVSRSTIRDLGVGLFNYKQGSSAGLAIVRDSTFTGNGFTAYAGGGAIDNRDGGTLVLMNATLSGNRAPNGALSNRAIAHLFNATITGSISSAGGIRNTASGTVTLRNTLVADNHTSGGTPAGCEGTLTSEGYNVIDTPTSAGGCAITGDATGNLLGVAADLGPLADNGGPTLTHTPLPGSPALDAGDPAGCTADEDNDPATADLLFITDQRGFIRPVDGNDDDEPRCDIGAVEGFAELFDGDQDGFSLTQGDCDDGDPAIHPEAAELCNTLDDDCNGAIDEGFALGGTCTVGIGACQQTGTVICTSGGLATTCSATGGAPSPEVCNGLDDDCNGDVDATALQPLTQVCYGGPAGTAGVGICREGTQTCLTGAFGDCQEEILPAAEVCDALDNDCNGEVDDDLTDPALGQACSTGQPGVCDAGTVLCGGGNLECIAAEEPADEVCDGLDNDCDGTVDENFSIPETVLRGDTDFGFRIAVDGDTMLAGLPTTGGKGVVLVLGRSGSAWTHQGTLASDDAAAFANFGSSVALAGDTALIGAVGADDQGASTGAAYVFVRSGTTWTQQARLTASDAAAFASFGSSVALDGDTALIGAFGDDAQGQNSGAAYVFVRSGTTWTEQAKLTAGDGGAGPFFGSSVALDGDAALVASLGEAVHVFVRAGTVWTEQATLHSREPQASVGFGLGVALAGDTAVVGANADDEKGNNAGAAYIFVRTGATWAEQAKLTASDAAAGDVFGASVALAGDTVLVGAPLDDDRGDRSGSAYVFTRTGTTWTEGVKLTASNGIARDRFGIAAALSGNTALVGTAGAGAAYVYQLPHELCDGQDNDCNGLADEGFAIGGACTAGIGACQRAGMLVCAADGAGTACTATPGAPQAEICGDRIDQDCDGSDEACPLNTPEGANVSVRPVDDATGTTPVTVSFSRVVTGGVTSLSTSSAGPRLPSGFALGVPPVYFDISTTATFTPPITVCIGYGNVRFRSESDLRLLHFEQGRWVDRTLFLDTQNLVVCASVSSLSPFAVAEPASTLTFFLHGADPAPHAGELFLDDQTPEDGPPEHRDSPPLSLRHGNPWKEIGTWTAAPGLVDGTLNALGDVRVWLGLRNSDDQGTRFDLRAEVRRGGELVAAGETLCISHLTRSPSQAKEVVVSFAELGSTTPPSAGDRLSLRILARIGTDRPRSRCRGHHGATGIRLYFDARSRASSITLSE